MIVMSWSRLIQSKWIIGIQLVRLNLLHQLKILFVWEAEAETKCLLKFHIIVDVIILDMKTIPESDGPVPFSAQYLICRHVRTDGLGNLLVPPGLSAHYRSASFSFTLS